MTHAALKDHKQTLREMFAVCANERRMKEADAISAALSAMEGEAVGHVTAYRAVHFYNDPPGPAAGTKLYTAPPPQQADSAVLLAAHNAVPSALVDAALKAYRECTGPLEWRIREAFRVALATHPTPPQQAVTPTPNWCRTCGKHRTDPLAALCRDPIHSIPTPSPGPQGGGDAAAVVCLVTEKRYPHFAEAQIQLYNGYEPKIGDRFYLATPPQPEAQVSDAMVERAALRFCELTGRAAEFANGWQSIIREVVTAALTTSGRDGE